MLPSGKEVAHPGEPVLLEASSLTPGIDNMVLFKGMEIMPELMQRGGD